jgi:16S rRNA (cytidine1402-2'-O)-methyltransferase
VNGRIYLIPVDLGGADYKQVIPEKVINLTKSLRFFVVENIRTARKYLRLIDKKFPIDETVFFELNEHTNESEIFDFLEPVYRGSNIGIMSEAGLPGIADPGSRLIEIAHRKDINVIPLSGPSSIVMALIASGLNGQCFTFNGYLPVKTQELNNKLKEIERRSHSGGTQIFMETPYRNQKLLNSIISVCNPDTKLCIAADISLPTEFIKTKKIHEWKKNIPSIEKRPVIFLLQL